MVIFLSIIKAGKETNMILKQILYILSLIWFEKNELKVLINLNNRVKTMTITYIAKLSFKKQKTNIAT